MKSCNQCKHSAFGGCEHLKNICSFERGSKEYYQFIKENTCDNFDSMFIEYPIEVSDIKVNDKYSRLYKNEIGKYCKVRYCNDNKTYLGLFLGELPHHIFISQNRETKVLNASFSSNPAMFVFELNEIVFGFESWWSIIESEKDLKEITDADINNVWYVKALQELGGE